MSALFAGIIAGLGGHLSNAFAALADKYLLRQAFQKPIFYVFWIGLISSVVFVLLPFQFALPHGAMVWALNILAGATFSIALFFYFSAIAVSDLTSAVPVIGSLTTVITALFSYVLLAEHLLFVQYVAIVLLLGGFWLLAGSTLAVPRKALVLSLIGAIFFALSSITMKQLFTLEPFIPALAFSRLGNVMISIIILFFPDIRSHIFSVAKGFGDTNIIVLLADHAAGAMGFVLLNLGVKLASPIIVSALQGAEYAFLFILVSVLQPFAPNIFRDTTKSHERLRKLAGIAIIAAGIALLSYGS